MKEQFLNVLNAYIKINEILLAENIEKNENYIYIQSKIKSPYFSFTIPITNNPNDFDLKDIEQKYFTSDNKSSIYLLEDQQKSGYTEFLVKNGYKFDGTDTWMVYDTNNINLEVFTEPQEISKETFEDFYKVLSVVFSDFSKNEEYQNVVKNSIGIVENNICPDFTSKVFVIYENQNPVSGGAMFYSKQENFAYLHDMGTLETSRGKGYQTALIRYRVNIALENEIENIFSLVEHGSQSWNNMIKNGFKQEHIANFFVKSN